MTDETLSTHNVTLQRAATLMELDEPALGALVRAGYLTTKDGLLSLDELRDFHDLNLKAEGPVESALDEQQPETLLDALEAKTEVLSHQIYEIYSRHVSEARHWNPDQRTTFIAQARGRLTAILAVAEQSSEIDDALQRDLELVGANAANVGASLPHLLLVLHLSRDLLLSTALEITSARNGAWDKMLQRFSLRLLSAIDNLVDSMTHGFWSTRVEGTHESYSRLADLIDKVPYGVYETDMDGIIRFANPALSDLVEASKTSLVGASLGDVIKPVDDGPSVGALFADIDNRAKHTELSVITGEKQVRHLDIHTVVRRKEGHTVGFGGIVNIAHSKAN